MLRFLCIVLFAITLQNSALAAERIVSFVSDVTVLQNGSLDVVETITVKAEGKKIRRGIYRDLPTSYPHPDYGEYGFKSKTPIDVWSLTRNGNTEAWHLGEVSNGERVFFGHASRVIQPGSHTYKLSYTIHRQIAKDNGSAIFYWNVTGNGWQFPIDTARINIRLPAGSSVFKQQAWTGRQGSTESNVRFKTLADGTATITTSQSLASYEGLTVKLAFDLTSLTLLEDSKWLDLYRDNKAYAWGMALLFAMLVFYTVVWRSIGRDPELGIIVARYRPLQDISAAAHRAIYRNAADDTSFAVGVLSAAIKGHLQIHQRKEGVYKLEATPDGDLNNLAPSELLLVNRLFAGSNSVTLGEKYSSSIEELKDDYEKKLKSEYAEQAHVNHLPWLIIGLVIGALGLAIIFLGNNGTSPEFLLPSLIGVIFVVISGAQLAKKKHLSPVYILAAGVLVVGLYALILGQVQFAAPLIFFALVVGVFTYLLPAPKAVGQQLINKIEGFRLYLSKAEHESLKRLNLPKKTPQLYEELLPFAIALDLETQWSDQFVEVLAKASKGDSNSNTYTSGWYHGSSHFGGMSSFAPALAAGLATSVVAASTPPSSSGSSSGGFSGGGGGGGGGGGW